MPKVVCEDCGEVLAEGVDPAEAEDIAEQHTHNDMPQIVDRTEQEFNPDSEGGSGTGGGGSEKTNAEYQPEGEGASNGADSDTDGMVEETDDGATIDEQLDEMDSLDDDRDPGDWWDVSDDDDYTEVSDEFERRHEKVQQQVEKDRSAVGNMLKHRDENIGRATSVVHEGDRGYAEAKDSQQWQDLRDDVADAFRQLKSRDVPKPSRKGNKLNMDAIVQRAAGDKSKNRLFHRTEQTAKGDRVVGVSVDFSGSMYASEAKMAVAAVGEATRIIGDDFVANCWAKDHSNRFGEKRNETTLGLITGPKEDFGWDQLSAFGTGGGTPTADGIDNITDIMDDMTAREKVVIVVTDGKPNVNFGGNDWEARLTGNAVGDAAHVVREARRDGYTVVGLGVGAVNDSTMATIFGARKFVSADDDEIARRLVEIYRDQLRV